MSNSKSNRKGRINFSNIFSPQSQIFLKGKRLKAREASNESRSPYKSIRGTVAKIPNIATFRQNNKVVLNDVNAQSMFERLQIEAQAQRRYDLRVRNKNYYLNYDYNPFTSQLQSQHNNSIGETQGLGTHLIHSYNQLRNVSVSQQAMSKLKQISNTLQSQVFNLPVKKRPIDPFKKVQKQQRKEKLSTPQLGWRESFERQEQFLDNIISIKQQRFIADKQDQKNIFALLFQKENRYLKCREMQLERHRLCRDSMLSTFGQKQKNRYKISPLLEISTYNRLIIRNNLGGLPDRFILDQGDINTNLDRIIFKDLILVANNKIQSQALENYILLSDPSAYKKNIQDKGVNPAINQLTDKQQKSVNCQFFDQNKIDLMYYGKASYTQGEEIQQQISNKQKHRLKKCLELQQKSIANSIRDRKLLKQLQERKNTILLRHLESNADPKLAYLKNQLERKVRMGKTNKSKAQKVKIDLLCESLRVKRSMENALKTKSPKKALELQSPVPMR